MPIREGRRPSCACYLPCLDLAEAEDFCRGCIVPASDPDKVDGPLCAWPSEMPQDVAEPPEPIVTPSAPPVASVAKPQPPGKRRPCLYCGVIYQPRYRGQKGCGCKSGRCETDKEKIRQLEALTQMGSSSYEIAEATGVSRDTVRRHVNAFWDNHPEMKRPKIKTGPRAKRYL